MTADRWRDTSGFVLDQGRRKNTVCAGAFAFDVEMESGAGRGAQAGPLPGGHHGPGPRRCGAVARGGGPAGWGRAGWGGMRAKPRQGRALRRRWPTRALRGWASRQTRSACGRKDRGWPAWAGWSARRWQGWP